MSDAERHRQLAIQHATIIQQRKSLEYTILQSLEELIDFPTAPDASADAPSPTDLAAVRKHMAPFQVSDYDALIEERNAVGTCGYVFCPRKYARDAHARGRFRIIWANSRGRGFRVVPAAELQKWCSIECARRAMYLKVQLSDVPAWERAGRSGNRFEILRQADADSLMEKMRRMTGAGAARDMDEESGLREAMAELSIERGEAGASSAASAASKISIRERDTHGDQAMKPENEKEGDESNYMDVEGYVPRTTGTGDVDDEMD